MLEVTMNSEFEDRPRSLKDPKVREERQKLLEQEPRVAALKMFVEEMRDETGHRDNIPHFDPFDGGIEACCLFLFEAAGGKAIAGGKTNGSGFVSRNNDDATAQKFFELNNGLLDRCQTISWNIVPWALRETGKNRPPTAQDIEKGKEWLGKLIDKLDLKVVVLCGHKTQKATGFLYEQYPSLCVLHAPHPSPQSMNQTGKEHHLWAAIRMAARRC
jgi:uracil-DNA glycosylase